jgi:hypothetical protein
MKLGDYAGSLQNRDNFNAAGRFGIGTHFAKDQLQELKAKIWKGAGAVEFNFMGKGKGVKSQGQSTPESYGIEERQAMRDLAKINDIKLSTHATVAAGSWSGFAERRFDENQRQQNIFEGKRAIDFAADVAEGGPVIIHTAEFPRSMSRAGADPKDPTAKGEFKTLGETEENKTIHYLVNKDSGELISAVREDQINHLPPELAGGKEGEVQWVDDKIGGQLKLFDKDWAKYVEEAAANRQKFSREILDPLSTKYDALKADDPAVLFYQDMINKELLQAKGTADEYEAAYLKHEAERSNLEKSRAFVTQELASKSDEEKITFLRRQARKDGASEQEIEKINLANFTEQTKDTLNAIDYQIQLQEKSMAHGRETATASRMKQEDLEKRQREVVSVHDYGVAKSADSISDLALHAMHKQQHKNLKRDLFIAPENIFPEMGYGSHPRELKELILKSRDKMIDKLTSAKYNYDEEKATDLAKRHIAATFDIGHANTWKKYFEDPKEGETPEEYDKRFQDWVLKQAKDLHKSGVLGHVHITDNFGYYDEHMSPGQGNAPIKEFVDNLEKDGYKGQITIETAEQDHKAMTEMWRKMNSPVYQFDGGVSSWTDVEGSYMGQTRSPDFLVGPTAPDPQTWTLWSGVPLE